MGDSRNRTPPDARPLNAAVADVLAEAGVGPGSRLCVALSGGVDSTVLFDVLVRLRATNGFSLSATHVHHGLSPNADLWRDFCKGLCARLGVPLSVIEVAVERGHPDGLEAAARHARHAALARSDADWLVFGHHQDDQAETLIFRLVRGTGVRGAGAMAPVEPGAPGRLRPFLDSRRNAIVAHGQAAGLTWIEDESNADQAFSRNRLRHALMPGLESAFPSAVPMLARAAENFREAEDLLATLARMDAVACGGDVLRLRDLSGLDDARIRNLFRWMIDRAGAEMPARARLVEAVRQMRASSDHPLYLSLGDVACCVYRSCVWIERIVADEPLPRRWRGEASLPWAGGEVRFDVVEGAGLDMSRLETAEIFLTVRSEGMSMRLGPGRPRRSFKKLCQESGLPAWLRSRLPVLCADGAPAWIAGIGVAGEFQCRPDGRGLLPVWNRTGLDVRPAHP